MLMGSAWPQQPQPHTHPHHHALPTLGDGTEMSLADERKLGDRIARELLRDPDLLEDAVLDDFVAQLWAPLLAAASQRGDVSPELRERFAWRIMLGKDRSINAFALPGGYLGVHLGLIAASGSRDELASVLAHELSHVSQRHIARARDAQGRMTPMLLGAMALGVLAASKNPQGASGLIVGGQAAALQLQLNYSRDMEREADRVGLGVMADAGYDPRGSLGLFAKLQQASALNDSGAFAYLRSHPLTTERLADVQSRLPPTAAAAPAQGDVVHAMMAARARVMSNPQSDALTVWAQRPQHSAPEARRADTAGHLYAATLANLLLRQPQQAWGHLQALQHITADHSAASRWVQLLRAQWHAQQNQHAQALQLLLDAAARSANGGQWQRPELVAAAQALVHLPGHAALPGAVEQLRQHLGRSPLDAQAWTLLAPLLNSQGLALAGLRAEGEAQMAMLNWQGAVDRFRAGQDMAKKGLANASAQQQANFHIEASIIDTRHRQAQELLREQQLAF